MMARDDSYAFWQESIRTNLTNITFTKDALLIPSNPVETWDVRADTTNGGQITAYLKDSENLIIYSPYKIYANPDASRYFQFFSNLTTIKFDNFDTSKVTDMQGMFYECSQLASLDVSKVDTSKVTTMWGMFSGCSQLTSLDISRFNTSNVTNMNSMFCGCSQLASLNLKNWQISKLENVTSNLDMFFGIPTAANIYVDDNDMKNWILNIRSDFENIQVNEI